MSVSAVQQSESAISVHISSASSVAQSCLNLCDLMNCMPSFPLHHHLPELSQTHVHRVGGAIQPSYPLSFPSPPAFNLALHQDLFQRVSSLYQVAKVLWFHLQHRSFQWTFRTDFLKKWLVWSPCSPRDLGVKMTDIRNFLWNQS